MNKNLDKENKEGLKVLFLAYRIKEYIEKLGDTKLSTSYKEHLCDLIEDGVYALFRKYETARADSNEGMKKLVRSVLKNTADKLFFYFMDVNPNDGRLLNLYDEINDLL